MKILTKTETYFVFFLTFAHMEHNGNQIFNTEQLAVICASEGTHLVLAPPGCGKTAVLAERVVKARQQGVAFEDMACLTFTNRASRGMKDRIQQRLASMTAQPAVGDTLPAQEVGDVAQLFVGNVHRFCSQFLFENGIVPDNAAIIDTDTSISIIADYLDEDELRILGDARQRQRYSDIINLQHLMYQCCHHYPGQLMVHRDALSATVLKELCMAFSLPYTQESAISLYRQADDYRDRHELLSADANRLLTNLYAAHQYEQYKRQNDLLDFEDLLLTTYDTIAAADGTADTPSLRRFAWIQVDEVQDLNPLQLAIIDLFTAPDATVVYLGDAQQAIFSFMGARMNTLEQLRQRCGAARLHNFYQNYRSPRYLLDVYNSYGQQQLHISPDLLPQTQNQTPPPENALLMHESHSNIDELNEVARMVKALYEAHPDETTAVIVAFNSDADDVSKALRLPHFKISGVDLFSTPDVQLLLAHLNVVHTEQNFIGWSRLFTGLRIYSSSSASRQFVHAMMNLAITPTDFLHYRDSTCLTEFVKAWDTRDMVVFDTETTGLNVFEDDVVQLAALRVRRGQITGRLNLFIETNRDIPPMLGDTPNPLVQEYAAQPHLQPAEAFARFLQFADGAVLLGHNATYDWQIMTHNMRRRASGMSMPSDCFDTLKMTRLLSPRLRSYKLKDLLTTLQLQGENSHLASDDIVATLSLAQWCREEADNVVGRQMEFIGRHRQTIERFRNLYGELHAHSTERLYQQGDSQALVSELQHAYDYLRELKRIGVIDKMKYLLDYVAIDLVDALCETSLVQQLDNHLQELNTMREADLCGSKSMNERVVVSTVHKAKGLEFDNVIVYDVVEGKYPSHYAATPEASDEEARKLYVAMSRARRRLVITVSHNAVTPYGRIYPRTPSPFLQPIQHFFK